VDEAEADQLHCHQLDRMEEGDHRATRMYDIDYLKTFVESMPRRLQDVIDREGATTKY
jgi:hypothetical protein